MINNSKRYVGLAIWIFLIILVGGKITYSVVEGLSIESNILKLLPENEQDPVVEQAFQRFSDKNLQRIVFFVAHQSSETASRASNELIDNLRANTYIVSSESGFSKAQQEQIARFSFDYRHQLMSEQDRELLKNKNYQAFIDFSLQQLYSPLATGMVELVQKDPFLLSYRKHVQGSDTQHYLKNDHGQAFIFENDVYYYLVTANLSESAFSPVVQQSIAETIQVVERRWLKDNTGIELIRTGALFYATDGYVTAKNEISTIGLGSLLGIVILVIVALRSLRPLLLIVVTLTSGIATGFCMVLSLFGEIHLITLVFGASLIGVAVDYAFHYLVCHQSENNFTRIKRIFPAITLGMFSSVIGYLALFTTPFPGLEQMAVFSATGLIVAYLTVVLMLPHVKGNNSVSIRLLNWCSQILVLSSARSARKIWFVLLLMPLIALATLWHSPVAFENIRQFQNKNESLVNQQQQIQKLLRTPEANQFFLMRASSEQLLLQKLEESEEALSRLVSAQIITGYQSVSEWLPSRKRQRENYQLYSHLFSSDALQSLSEIGLFEERELVEIRQKFASQQADFLAVEQWLASPMGKQLGHLWLGQVGSDFVAVIAIRGIQQLDALADLNLGSAVESELVFVDKVSTVSNLFQAYKENAAILLLCALGLIFLMLLFRHGIRISAIIISVPLIAIATTLVLLTVLSIPISLFNTLALFLVLGIGIDYGVFFAETRQPEPDLLMAIVLSAITTLLSFGLLSLSETPAIYAFGSTMLFGISLSLLLAPITGSLMCKLRSNEK